MIFAEMLFDTIQAAGGELCIECFVCGCCVALLGVHVEECLYVVLTTQKA